MGLTHGNQSHYFETFSSLAPKYKPVHLWNTCVFCEIDYTSLLLNFETKSIATLVKLSQGNFEVVFNSSPLW